MTDRVSKLLKIYGFMLPKGVVQILIDLAAEIDLLRADVDAIKTSLEKKS